MAMDVVDENGRPLRHGKGELVCRKPFPSMPAGFWNDPKGEKYRAAHMIFGLSHAAEGNSLADQALLLAKRPMLVLGEEGVDFIPHRCVDDTRGDAVDIDPVSNEVEPRPKSTSRPLVASSLKVVGG